VTYVGNDLSRLLLVLLPYTFFFDNQFSEPQYSYPAEEQTIDAPLANTVHANISPEIEVLDEPAYVPDFFRREVLPSSLECESQMDRVPSAQFEQEERDNPTVYRRIQEPPIFSERRQTPSKKSPKSKWVPT
jgi:hypothetical protein